MRLLTPALTITVALLVSGEQAQATSPTADQLIDSIPVLSDRSENLKSLRVIGTIAFFEAGQNVEIELVSVDGQVSLLIRDPYDHTPFIATSGKRVLLFNAQSRTVLELPNGEYGVRLGMQQIGKQFGAGIGLVQQSDMRNPPLSLDLDVAPVLHRQTENQKVIDLGGGRYRFEGKTDGTGGSGYAVIAPEAPYPLRSLALFSKGHPLVDLRIVAMNDPTPPRLAALPARAELEKHYTVQSSDLSLEDDRILRMIRMVFGRSALIRHGVYESDDQKRKAYRAAAERQAGQTIDWTAMAKTVKADAKIWAGLLPATEFEDKATDAESSTDGDK